MKKLLKIVAVLVLLLVVVVALLPTLAGGWIEGRVRTGLADGLDAQVSLESFDFGWTSGLKAEKVSIDRRDPNAPDLELASLELRPDLLALLGGALVVSDGRARGLVVRMRRGASDPAKPSPPTPGGEGSKTERPAPAPAPSAPTELPLGLDVALLLEDLTIIVESPDWAEPAALRSFRSVRARIASGKPVTVALRDDRLEVDVTAHVFEGQALLPADRMSAEVRIVAKGQELSRYAEALAPWYRITAGRFDADQTVTWNGDGGKVGASGRSAFAGLTLEDVARGGSHRFDAITLETGLVPNAAGEPVGPVTLALRGGRSEGLEGLDRPLDLGTVDLRAALESGRKVRIETAAVRGDLMHLDASGLLDLGGEVPGGDFSLDASAELERLARFFAGREDLRGRIETKASLKSDSSGRLVVRGRTEIANFRADPLKEGMKPVDEKLLVVKHDLTLDDRTLLLEDVGIDSSFAKAKVSGTLEMPEGDAGARGAVALSGSAELEQLMALAGGLVPATATGKLDFDGSYDGGDAGGRFSFGLRGERIAVETEAMKRGPLDLGAVTVALQGTMKPEGGVLDIPEMTLRALPFDLRGKVARRAPEGAEADLELTMNGTADLDRLMAPFVEEALPASALARSRLSVDLRRLGQRTTLRKAELAAGGTTATLTGETVTVEGSPTMGTLNYDLKGVLADVAPLARAFGGVEVGGSVTAAGKVGLGAEMTVTSKGTAKGLALGGERLSGASLQARDATFDLALRRTEGRPAVVDTARATVAGGRWSKPGATALSGDLALNGGVDSEGRFTFEVRGTEMSVQAPEDPAPKRMRSALVAKTSGKLDREADRYALDTLSVKGDGLDLSGSGSFAPGRSVDLRTKATLDNAVFASTWLAIFLEDVAGKGKGNLDFDVSMPMGEGADRSLSTGSLTAKLDELRVGGVTLTALDVAGTMTGGVGKLDRGDARLNGGPAKVTASVDLRPEEPVFDVGIDAKQVELVKKLQPAVARVIPIFGDLGATVQTKLDVAMSLKGRGSNIDAVLPTLSGLGSFAANAGSVTGSPMLQTVMSAIGAPPRLDFNALQTSFQVKDGGVSQDGLVIDGAVVDLRLSGKTSFDGSLDYVLGIKPKPGKVAQWDRFSALLGKDGFLPLGLGGKVGSPTPKMPDPSQLVGGALEGALKDRLGGLLGGDKKDGEKKDNPLDALGGLLGGNKPKPKTEDKPDGGTEKKDPGAPKNPLEALGGLLGGNKPKTEPKTEPKPGGGSEKEGQKPPVNPLEALGGLLGGGDKPKKDEKPAPEAPKPPPAGSGGGS